MLPLLRFLLPLALLPILPAADWPQWRGPTQDGHAAPGTPRLSSLPAAPTVVWEQAVGDGLGSPVVSDGRVFLLDHQDGKEVVHAFKSDNGAELWHRPIDDVFRDTQSAPRPRSTPMVDGDRVYVVSCQGEFQCLNVADGKLVWRTHYVKDFGAVFFGERGPAAGASRHGNTASPLVLGDDLLMAVGGTNGASVVRCDKRTGQVRWKSQDDIPGHSGPVLARLADIPQAISFTSPGVMAVDPRDGRLLWRVPVKSTIGRHITTPVIAEDLVLVSSRQAGLIAFKPTPPAAAGEPWPVETAWVSKELAVNFSCPVAVNGHLYGVGPTPNLFCADIRNGRSAWSKEGLFAGSGETAYAGFILLGNAILMLADTGEIILFAADPKEYRELGRAQVCGRNWCNPAFVDGRLFVRDAKTLRAVNLKP